MAYNGLVMAFSFKEIKGLPTNEHSQRNANLLVIDYDNKYVTNEYLGGFNKTYIFDIHNDRFTEMSAALILKAAFDSIESGKILVMIGSDKRMLLDIQTLLIQIFGLKQNTPMNSTDVELSINNKFYVAAADVNLWDKMTYGN